MSPLVLFAAWLAALLLLFGLGLRLPLQARLSMWPALARTAAIVVAALGIAIVANVALYRHDAHFDLTAGRAYTPPPQAQALAAGLTEPMTVTYFYNPADGEALQAKRLLEVLAHGAPLLEVDPVEIDRQPALARRYQVRAYNTAVIETEGRRIKVERTTDLAQIALGALRALRQQTPVVCFVTGHGEFAGGPASTPPHYSHQETLDAHQGYGSEDRLMAAPDGLDRLYLALEQQGYEVREIALATLEAVPDQCAALIDLGPRRAYAANEADLLHGYLGRGGGLLLGYDPESTPGPGAAALLAQLGVEAAAARVTDPLDHYGTDPEVVAVPSYTRHPITDGIALTFYPGARPLSIGLPPASITLFPLFGSSKDSSARPVNGSRATAALAAAAADADVDPGNPEEGPQILALALTGQWPEAAAGATPFRAVVVGDSDFVTNAYFDQVANGELGVAMIRWLARDDVLPGVRPERSTPPIVTMTGAEMRWTFIALEILLPLSVVLIGSAVWWRRR